MNRGLVEARDYVHFQMDLIPDYWEPSELLDGSMKILHSVKKEDCKK